MRILSVVGARPQFVKLAPISLALEDRADHVIIHTGQHYDELMSEVFFRELGIPEPTVNLGVGSGSHGQQTGRMLERLEREIQNLTPDWVLVYGDTNSTLAAAIAAVKLHVPLAHLESGLRSFNRRMPEEHNRVLTDHAADLLLAPTMLAMENLKREGLTDRSVLVGDVMTDVLYKIRDKVINERIGAPQGFVGKDYYLATIHRPDNTDNPERLRGIVGELSLLNLSVLLLAHPRLRENALKYGIGLEKGSLRALDPLPYTGLVSATMHSAGVITDSGGLQKEAFLLRVPTTTLRSETEWVETLESDWNVLAHDTSTIASAVSRPTPKPTASLPYGDGNAAVLVANELLKSR